MKWEVVKNDGTFSEHDDEASARRAFENCKGDERVTSVTLVDPTGHIVDEWSNTC